MVSRPAAGIVSIASTLLLGFLSLLGTRAAPPFQEERKATALVYGSVFSEEGLALRGARIEIRRKQAKKPKWKTRTNRRGEFAVRLPRASGEYVLTVSAESYAGETKEFEVTLEERFNFYFRLKHPESEEDQEEDGR